LGEGMNNIFITYCAGVLLVSISVLFIVYKLEERSSK